MPGCSQILNEVLQMKINGTTLHKCRCGGNPSVGIFHNLVFIACDDGVFSPCASRTSDYKPKNGIIDTSSKQFMAIVDEWNSKFAKK